MVYFCVTYLSCAMCSYNILRLYESILVPIFSDWINEWELCHVDSAVTERKLRINFLNVLSRCTVANEVLRNECYHSKFEWIALRQLGVRRIDFNFHFVLRYFH